MSHGGWYVQDSRRGISPRFLLALAIAGIGLFSYCRSYQRNPVTGELQAVAMSTDQEMALGLQAAPKMAAKMGGVVSPEKDPRAALVAEVGRRIVRRSQASSSPYAGNFHFYLLDDPKTLNAFALPGGQIFVTRGLLDKLETEAELAGVLGHEVGHVIGRHSAEQMAKGQLGRSIASAVGIGASDGRRSGLATYAAAAMANQMLQLRYGRKDESEADEFGLKFMADAGYDPRAMIRVMEVLRDAAQGGSMPEILSSHPLPANRLVEIRDRLKQLYPRGVPDDLTEGRRLHARALPADRTYYRF